MSHPLSACLPAVVLLVVLASNTKLASATPNPSLSHLLQPSANTTGGPVSEIQCYALPYGAIGIISHLLTYWTMAWMAMGRIPLWPWHSTTKYKLDAALACISLVTCIPIAAVALHRCRLTWHFQLICVWKLVTSVSLACITLHRCIITRRNSQNVSGYKDQIPLRPHIDQGFPYDPYKTAQYSISPRGQMYQQVNNPSFFSTEAQPHRTKQDLKPLWWLMLFLSGTIVGMVGLCALLYTTFRQDQTIRHLTYGFGIAITVIPALVTAYWYMQYLGNPSDGGRTCLAAFWHCLGGGALAFIAVFGFFASLYSDLILGTIANNIIGVPSSDSSGIYWSWFIAKRVPMLSL